MTSATRETTRWLSSDMFAVTGHCVPSQPSRRLIPAKRHVFETFQPPAVSVIMSIPDVWARLHGDRPDMSILGAGHGCRLPAQPLHETISIMETMDTVLARGDV